MMRLVQVITDPVQGRAKPCPEDPAVMMAKMCKPAPALTQQLPSPPAHEDQMRRLADCYANPRVEIDLHKLES